MTEINPKHLLNKRQVADYLGLRVYTIDSWVSQKKIPFVKVGRCVRFRPEAIESWLKERTVEPVPV